MLQLRSPYVTLLNEAADRLFLNSIWLGDQLRDDPSGTLYALSVQPETFGGLKPCHNEEARLVRLRNLLTAAKAYITAERKLRTLAVDRLELTWSKPKL